MLRFRWLSITLALLLSALVAPLAFAVQATARGSSAPPRAGPITGAPGRFVQATIVRPRPGVSRPLATSALIPIGRATSEEEYQHIKKHGGDPRHLGGREEALDSGATTATRPASLVSSFDGLPQYYSVPYDAAIAAGRSQVLVMTNNQFGVFDEATGTQLAYGLYWDFFGSAAGGGFDPKCFYDASAERFVMVVVEAALYPDRALVDIAVSQGSDATGGWYKYSFDAMLDGATPTDTWSDYPGVGYDDSNVYCATDQYVFAGDDWQAHPFAYAKLRCWSKEELYAGGAATYVDFSPLTWADGRNALAVKPARPLTPTSIGRFLATRSEGGSSVSIWTMSGVYPQLTLSAPESVLVGPYEVGHDAAQPDTPILIDTGDCRTQDVVWRNGYYVAFTERSPADTNLTAVRYIQVSDDGQAVRDITYQGEGRWFYYPAVSVDPAGNVAMVFGRSSGTEYASMYQTRLPVGSIFDPSQLVKAGVGSITRERWGDFSGVANDPLDPGLLWIFGGYADLNNRWATQVASIRPASSTIAVEPPAERADADLQADLFSRGSGSRIVFTLGHDQKVKLAIYDLSGRAVRSLADGQYPAGRRELNWDGRAEQGGRAAPGLYWVRLATERAALVRRLIVLR